MDTKMMSQFEIMDTEMLETVCGGDFAKVGVGAGMARGFQLGIKTEHGKALQLVLQEELYLEV